MIISAGTLGDLAMANFCPRCFWIKLRCEKLPFQIPMPGVFSAIDSYIKNLVYQYYDREGRLPAWFPPIGNVLTWEKVPSWQKFQVTEPRTEVTLRGTPDAVFQLLDSSYHIVDYKTARLTAAQDKLLPRYEVQLNAYAYIANRTFFAPVSALSLIYLEPDTALHSAPELLNYSDAHLMLRFVSKIRSVDLKPDSFIEGLLNQANEIDKLEAPPVHTYAGQDCELLERLIQTATLSG